MTLLTKSQTRALIPCVRVKFRPSSRTVLYLGTRILLLALPILFTVPFVIIGAFLQIPWVLFKAFVRCLGFGKETSIGVDSFAA
ncbi:hypothetical protein CYLTODRAFT_427398 [Cylindrobasidium torrendii FP15055 ss-10]|uniref:Uncharacterized protein n=1 Tax=Cylindrobasidium torrendii FP15055 ss-10 TaxID=1314674 RepID=A0A0D7AU34_9AGAR|nr:hypothetical protein CYLTODRAFT_427398 [Cylindrobasidium torrendii FP15055 ss-10]